MRDPQPNGFQHETAEVSRAEAPEEGRDPSDLYLNSTSHGCFRPYHDKSRSQSIKVWAQSCPTRVSR